MLPQSILKKIFNQATIFNVYNREIFRHVLALKNGYKAKIFSSNISENWQGACFETVINIVNYTAKKKPFSKILEHVKGFYKLLYIPLKIIF